MRVCCAAMLVGGVLEWRKVREYAEATAYSVAQAFICITYTFAPESVETRLRAPSPKGKISGSGPGRQPGTSSRGKWDSLMLRDFIVATSKLH